MAEDAPAWTPTVAQVSARLRARTRHPNGTTGEFDTETSPTAAQVEEVITQAVQLLRPRLGPVPVTLVDQAQAVATLRACFMVEIGSFPEQVQSAMSPYAALEKEYKDALCDFDTAAEGREPNSETELGTIMVGTVYPGYALGTY